MKIHELLEKDIFRSINGVVKADQRDDGSVRQELDEFVVTKELGRHLDRFFSNYKESLDNPADPDISGKIGIWVSGFFGSGKSHLIKILSYVFNGVTVDMAGQPKVAMEFFENKIQDPMLLGDIKRSASQDSRAILFNIDSKADQSRGRDAILAVFLKVLNEQQGYSPDHPHIAHMERYLDRKGVLGTFHEHYHDLTGHTWIDERDSYMFNQDEIVRALSKTLGQSEEACHRWINNADSEFELTVENFAKWTREYLDTQGPDHRILFFVDEIGQFIGQDGHLMLSLQTIVENLGVACDGRAWVIVTSQEDIDTVLGSMSNARSNDFSKIQGRFKTRLSLSSANTDEVIQSRLLEKKEAVRDHLKETYRPNADILKSQLSFSKTGMTLNPYRSEDDFVKNYPFIPYQFQLLQKVFETIRRAGATGLHLSRGERSMLDAFQYAGKKAAKKEEGLLVPLYWFYPSIESFLDTAVKRTIEQAAEKPTLHEFDIEILRTLFMIRYVEEVKGNIDNLVTLCIDKIDADRFALKKQIEETLARLEKEHLIGRNGDDYFFLTNEERDVSREISNVELEFGSESRQLGTILFDETYKENRKHRYTKTGKDFDLSRFCDLIAHGGKVDEGIMVSVITPFCEDYGLYDKARCILDSNNEGGHTLIRLPEQNQLGVELRTYLKTEKYIARKNVANPEIERILRDRKEENRQRKTRLVDMVKAMLAHAEYYAAGQHLSISATEPITSLSDAVDYLIDNSFSKMGYIEHPCHEPMKEVQAVLRSNDIGQESLNLSLPEHNPKAAQEVREYIDLCTKTSKQIVVHDLITKRFSNRPYGWPDWETMLILARLVVAGEIQFVMHNDIVETKGIYDLISKTSNWRKITIKQRKMVDSQLLEQTRKLSQELFGQMGPDNEDGLFTFFTDKLTDWQGRLKEYNTLAETGQYPGKQEIAEGLGLIAVLLADKESFRLINRLKERKTDLLDFADAFHDVNDFYQSQRPVWEKLRKVYERFLLNRFELEKDPDTLAAFKHMETILQAPAPYALIKDVNTLINKVAHANDTLVSTHRTQALATVGRLLDELEAEITKAGVDPAVKNTLFQPLASLKSDIQSLDSVAHLQQIEHRAGSLFDQQTQALADHVKKAGKDKEGEPSEPVVKPTVTIRRADVVTKPYLETQSDVDQFVGKLKDRLSAEIANNKRVRIE